MDGVLIDSEIVSLNHTFQRLKKWYPAVEKDGLYRVVGASSKKTMEIIREEIGAICWLSPHRPADSKPKPEIYLLTAGVLPCTPLQCLVVEDSTYGIMAGHGAVMTTAAGIQQTIL